MREGAYCRKGSSVTPKAPHPSLRENKPKSKYSLKKFA